MLSNYLFPLLNGPDLSCFDGLSSRFQRSFSLYAGLRAEDDYFPLSDPVGAPPFPRLSILEGIDLISIVGSTLVDLRARSRRYTTAVRARSMTLWYC